MGWEETYRTELPRLAEVVVVSTHMKERILEYGVSPARVHVVPCGAATLDESVARDLEETYSNRSRNGDGFKLVAVGRLVAKKGPMFLLEAFRQIRASGVPAELYIIGDGPFREAMSQWIASNHFGESVRLVGALPNPEVRRHLREADLFLQHSITAEDGDEEGLPVAILEAMAEGVPVVSTLHAGIPEAVCHGETGFLVRPGDCRAMADKACDLLRDGKLRHRMGRAARTVVTTQFSLNRQIDTLRNIVQKYMH
jgi:glycosyltransferase involved in cell wall biosynthesis